MHHLPQAIRRLPFLVCAVLVLASAADAQQAAPSAPAKPNAAKSAPKSAAKPKPKADPAMAPTGSTTPATPSVAGGAQPTLLGTYGEWGAYTASPGGRKICFALAKPTNSETVPANRPRDPAYMFVSSRPAEKVKDEVSIVIGYGFKHDTDATLVLGGASYAMYTQEDGAWLKNAAEEAHLVDAMRKGSDVTIKGTSARGTSTTDVFSLRGLAQALDKVGEECQ
ncbi:MAG TPA: invasion associated locus B family protein [Xanthobacteraceae bacterium]|nr:invasion associated locus B family protein [Xanthobacteraceae bacterium]